MLTHQRIAPETLRTDIPSIFKPISSVASHALPYFITLDLTASTMIFPTAQVLCPLLFFFIANIIPVVVAKRGGGSSGFKSSTTKITKITKSKKIKQSKSTGKSSTLTGGVVAGIVLGVTFFVAIVFFVVFFIYLKKKKFGNQEEGLIPGEEDSEKGERSIKDEIINEKDDNNGKSDPAMAQEAHKS